MATIRTIAEVSQSTPVIEGAGVQLRRAFGFTEPERYDPFLLFDDFRSDIPEQFMKGFPWHPHRGIETITYVLKGDLEHGDSLGNKGTISDGEVQWMTAGSGIIHQEMPKGDNSGSMHGFQLWLNLPRKDKMCPPKYRDIGAGEITGLRLDGGVEVKIICGELADAKGPVNDIATTACYFDILVPPGSSYSHPTALGDTAIVYIIEGSGEFSPGEAEHGNRTLLLYGDGEEIALSAGTQGVRFLLMTGRPLKEPIAWQGPIVMNSREELQQAFQEYQNGTFLR
jgi:redox-sensitive bicupin YhaK (pirin superfamily)